MNGHGNSQKNTKNWLGLNWQLGSATGWGVLGLNMAAVMEKDRRFKPVSFAELGEIKAETNEAAGLVARLNKRSIETRHLIDGKKSGLSRCRFPVIHSLGNNVHFEGLPKMRDFDFAGSINFAICVFEKDYSNDFTFNNAAQFEVVFAGCKWNQAVLKKLGLPNTDLFLHGIDSSIFYPRPKREQNRFVVFAGGKLEYRKGQDIVVAAFRLFAKRHSDAVLATVWQNPWSISTDELGIAGHVDGSIDVDENGCQKIEEWAVQNGIPPSQIVDLGMVPNSMMSDVYDQASVAVFASRCEGGTNMVAMEAMASGVPCILSANTGHLDLMTEDNCFPLFKQSPLNTQKPKGISHWRESDVDELVEALERVYHDREEANARGSNGAKFMGDWTWERRTRPLIERIQQSIQDQ